MSPEAGRGGLGRGLASLIPQRTASLAAPAEVPLSRIRRNPHQPRSDHDQEALAALAASITLHGVLQPIVVTEVLDGYQLVAGERRVRAAELAGLERIPAIIRQVPDEALLELALVENLQRADLAPLDEARAYRQLIGEFGLTQDEVARQVGRARSSIANTLRLLELAPAVQEALAAGRISEGHARAIGGLDGASAQAQVVGIVVTDGLSVRQTEELVRRLHDRPPEARRRQPRQADPELDRIEGELRIALGTKVTLARTRRGGRIVIEYYGDEDLGRLYERLVGSDRD
ncbi:MAG: hypothetical protein A2X23_13390 [Chloroflexi bacterium GWC2_73_18]|nr:MAG: hypothetical protein A2X23_13390 [Chloroflexi bacterium GWC2_73_18]